MAVLAAAARLLNMFADDLHLLGDRLFERDLGFAYVRLYFKFSFHAVHDDL